MSKTNAFETDWNTYIFNDTALAGVGDAGGLRNTGGTGGAVLYMALFQNDPGDSGTTSGTEVAYGGYVRKSIARGGTSGFTISGNNATNTSTITWATCTSGSNTANYIGIMAESSGSNMVYVGTLDTPISITVGVAPQILAGELDINEN
jgi:hypothetical protein